MLVLVGLMTRCVTQVFFCMHGHLDMLVGNPWCHGRCGRLVLVLAHGVSHACICRQDTHTSWLHSHCILALRSWEAHWGFDELSEIHIQANPLDSAQVGQESKQVGQVSLHLFSSVPGMYKGDGGCGAHWVPTKTRSWQY